MKNRIGRLEYNLEEPYAKNAFKRACSADDVYIALHDIAQQIFRPARKHGYQDQEIQSKLENCGTYPDGEFEGSHGHDLVRLLEKSFYRILEERDVNLDDLE